MGTDSITSEDDDICWQEVTSPKSRKRKTSDSPKIYLTKKQHGSNNITLSNDNDSPLNSNHSTQKNDVSNINNLTGKKVSTNRFQILSDDNDDGSEAEQISKNNVLKPPPIIIPNVTDISSMVKSFSSLISPLNFTFKSIKGGQIRVMVKDIPSYRTLVTFLNEKNIKFHTYQIKQERSYRVILKNLHPSTPIDEIKNAFESLGHKVRNVSNMRSKLSKEPLPLFFIDLEPSPNNKEVYAIKAINNAIVNIVPPRKSNDLVQCHRCQEFGHTKTYCRKSVNCVKCGLGHLTADCPKDKNTPPRCVNCLKDHPASYKGCIVYKQLLRKKLQKHERNRQTNDFNYNYNDFPSLNDMNNNNNNNNNNFNNTDNPPFYSTILKSNQTNSFEKIEKLIQNQIELTNKLLNMMTLLISKLCN